jgi:hypothetical protein
MVLATQKVKIYILGSVQNQKERNYENLSRIKLSDLDCIQKESFLIYPTTGVLTRTTDWPVHKTSRIPSIRRNWTTSLPINTHGTDTMGHAAGGAVVDAIR